LASLPYWRIRSSIIHGEPRLTNDIDLVADIREEQISQLVAALETDFYVDDRAIRRAIRERRSLNIGRQSWQFQIYSKRHLTTPESISLCQRRQTLRATERGP
jgi:hypothetical protein